MELVPAERINQATWEIHRALLAKLYVGENKSVKDIKAYMVENHRFMATEKQYQACFNKWGFKKNLKKSDWEYVQHRTQKRKAEGKPETAVYLNGVEVSSKRVKKELDRHFPPRFSAHASASSPQTPPGVIVKTPESSSTTHELAAIPEVLGDLQISLNDLPLFDSIAGTPENIPTPELLDALGISIATPSRNPTVTIRLDNLPWFRFLDLFRSFDGKPQSPHTVPRIYNSPSRLQELFQETFAGTFRENLGSDHDGSTSRIINAFLATGEEESNFQTLAGNLGSSALLQFFKYLAYMASNNMVALGKIDGFLQWISDTSAYSTLDSFLSLQTTTSVSLGNLLFGSALRHEDVAAVKCLLRAGVDPSTPISQHLTRPGSYINPLHLAAKTGNAELVGVLLDGGADIDAMLPMELCDENDMFTAFGNTKYKATPLHIAAFYKRLDAVQILLSRGCKVNKTARFPSHTSVLELALRSSRRTALVQASKNGHDDIVKFLIESGAEVNARPALGGFTAIQAAARAGNREMVDTLLAADADINAAADGDFGRTALQAAIQNDHVELAHHLIEQGADIHAPPAKRGGVTALQAASIRGQLGFAISLLQAGADANASPAEEDGRTALEGAAEHGRLDMVQLLLNCNAGRDIVSVFRALRLAIEEGHVGVVNIIHDFMHRIQREDESERDGEMDSERDGEMESERDGEMESGSEGDIEMESEQDSQMECQA